MKVKIVIITIFLLFTATVAGHASDGKILSDLKFVVKNPSVDDICGLKSRTYHDVNDTRKITLFRFRGVRIENAKGVFTGSWHVDHESGNVIIQRFDSDSTFALVVYKVIGQSAYVLGYPGSEDKQILVSDVQEISDGQYAGNITPVILEQ